MSSTRLASRCRNEPSLVMNVGLVTLETFPRHPRLPTWQRTCVDFAFDHDLDADRASATTTTAAAPGAATGSERCTANDGRRQRLRSRITSTCSTNFADFRIEPQGPSLVAFGRRRPGPPVQPRLAHQRAATVGGRTLSTAAPNAAQGVDPADLPLKVARSANSTGVSVGRQKTCSTVKQPSIIARVV